MGRVRERKGERKRKRGMERSGERGRNVFVTHTTSKARSPISFFSYTEAEILLNFRKFELKSLLGWAVVAERVEWWRGGVVASNPCEPSSNPRSD